MPLRIHSLPTLASFSMGAISGIVIFAAVFVIGDPNHNIKAQDDYGNTLASMTAKRAVDASFNNDLVRLQTMLKDVVAHPRLVQATAHDVEHNLLVQAGQVRPMEKGFSSYTAAIVLHKQVAGYVTLTLQNFDERSNKIWHALAMTLLLLFGLTGGSLYKNRAVELSIPKFSRSGNGQSKTQPNLSTNNKPPLDPQPSEVLSQTPEKQALIESNCVSAVIQINNMGILRHQLSDETFINTIRGFENLLAEVLTLYSGNGIRAEDQGYILSFGAAGTDNEAVFRAACSGFLLLEIASIINKVPLDLCAFVSSDQKGFISEKHPFSGVVLDAKAAADKLVKNRLNFMGIGTEDGRQIVSGFQEPFSSLLENQKKQLSQIHP